MSMSNIAFSLLICLYVILNKLFPAGSWLFGIVLFVITVFKVEDYLSRKYMERIKNKGKKP
jgi:hypothetical protein